MKESESKAISRIRLKHIIGVIGIIICISVISSYITARILVPELSKSTPTPTAIPTIQLLPALPSTTLNPTQPSESEFEEPLRENKGFEIETNLLQNGGFEKGLSGWTNINDPEGITIFETDGVNGKAFCSRRPVLASQTDTLHKEWIGFAQKIPLDPTQTYFFSAWVKLNDAQNINVYAKFYNGVTEAAIQGLANFGYKQPESSQGWFFIHSITDPTQITHNPNQIEIEIVHGKLDVSYDAPPSFSTICIDDVFFGKIVK